MKVIVVSQSDRRLERTMLVGYFFRESISNQCSHGSRLEMKMWKMHVGKRVKEVVVGYYHRQWFDWYFSVDWER